MDRNVIALVPRLHRLTQPIDSLRMPGTSNPISVEKSYCLATAGSVLKGMRKSGNDPATTKHQQIPGDH